MVLSVLSLPIGCDCEEGSLMRSTSLAIAAMLSVLASEALAQGTKQYSGPVYPTNPAPYSTGTTPATPNWRANSYGY